MKTSKKCPRCKEVKPVEVFGVRKTPRYAGEINAYCKPCVSTDLKQRYRANREAKLVKSSANYYKNRDRELLRRKARYQSNPSEAMQKAYECSKRRRAKRYALLAEIKSVPCSDCKLVYPAWLMDFDHVRGTKSCNVSEIVRKSFSKKRLLAEIEKCELVCSNCHRNRTHCRKEGTPIKKYWRTFQTQFSGKL